MSFQEELNTLKDKLINRIILVSFVFVGTALGASLMRAVDIGWQPIFNFHILIFLLLGVFFFIKEKIPLKLKFHFLFSLFFLVVMIGLINFRTISASFLIIVVISFATLLFGIRIGLLYSIIYMLAYLGIGLLHMNNLIPINIDFGQYVNNTTTWFSHWVIYGFIFAILIIVFDMHYKLFVGLLEKNYKKNIALKEANKQIDVSKQQYKSIFTGSKDGFLFVDDEYRIIKCNQSYLDMHGYELNDVLGKDYKELMPKADFDWDEFFLNLAGSGEFVELETFHKDGSTFPIETRVFKANYDDVHLWAVIRDLREKKQLEKEVFKTMVHSEEKERERYAKELHDGLGPLISTGMIYVNTIQNEEKLDLIYDYSVRAYDILLEATNVVREISNNLSPLILKEYGMVHAMRSFIEKTQNITEIKFTIADHLEGRFDETLETTMYRTLVELTNNSIKYSKAKHINYSFNYENGELKINYKDDGVGFDYQKAIDNHSGFGLLNLQNRIKKLRGYYLYNTSPGKGVEVYISIKTKYE